MADYIYISSVNIAKFRNLFSQNFEIAKLFLKLALKKHLSSQKEQGSLGNTNMLRWDVFPGDYDVAIPLR